MPRISCRRLVALVVALSGLIAVGVGAQGGSVSTVASSLEAAAKSGIYDAPSAIDALYKAAGPNPSDAAVNQITAETLKLQDLFDKAKAAGKDNGQNASFTADWNLGFVKRGYTYTMNFPLKNGCRIPQVVTVTYPTTPALVGQTEVPVPPYTTVNVPLSWKVPELPPMLFPPMGVNLQQTFVTGFMFMSEPGGSATIKSAQGTYSYVCDKALQVYSVFADELAVPLPPDQGGGGGKPPAKKKPSVCATLWNAGLFTPDATHTSPEQCASELRPLAADLLTNDLPFHRALYPEAWSWLPPPSAVDKMSAHDLLALQDHAKQVLKATEGIK
jgi:hypothetical protein